MRQCALRDFIFFFFGSAAGMAPETGLTSPEVYLETKRRETEVLERRPDFFLPPGRAKIP